MCQHPLQTSAFAHLDAPADTVALPPGLALAPEPPGPTTGSRRRRLWELGSHAHCPVIGVCLPMATVRKLTTRIGPPMGSADDYELHGLAVGESRRRSLLAEAIQKDLDQRHALAIRRAAKLKTSEALWDWWQTEAAGPKLGEALWVTLTHPRCDAAIEHKALGMVHMLQHQVGVACRVDQARYEALLTENASLSRHLAQAQERFTRQTRESGRQTEALEAALVRARAELLGRDTVIQQLHDEHEQLRRAAPDLPERLSLQQARHQLHEQLQDLRRQAQALAHEAERQRLRADAAENRLALATARPAPTPSPMPADAHPARPLAHRSVLCVGGRPGVVPIYREIIEEAGGRFLHHDGGEEDNASQLDATLAAADLVICQTGCVSHNAYWRVKAHCKRHGKRCVFVDTPSQSALSRALAESTDPAT